MMKTLKPIRLGYDDWLDDVEDHFVDICPHIKISGEIVRDDDVEGPGNPEYSSETRIICAICEETYQFDDWIN